MQNAPKTSENKNAREALEKFLRNVNVQINYEDTIEKVV